MPRKINWEFYAEVYDYLNDNHTYIQTKEKFNISEMQISRIKKKMKEKNLLTKEINKVKPNDVEIVDITEDLTKVTVKPKTKISKGITLKNLGYSNIPKTESLTFEDLFTPRITVRRIAGIFDMLFNKTIEATTKKGMLRELITELKIEEHKL